MSVLVFILSYMVITPILSVFALIFFIEAEVVYTHQIMYVYTPKADSGRSAFEFVHISPHTLRGFVPWS